MKIKISGITRMREIEFLSELKPDFVGFVFDKNAVNYITPQLAALLAAKLHPVIRKVGVFANSTIEEINETVRITGIDLVQLNGDETPYFISQLEFEVWKNISVSDNIDRKSLKAYGVPLAVHIDALGLQTDVGLIQTAAALGPIIFSGGVNIENITELAAIIPPYAVDVSGSVSSPNGFKDYLRCKEFIAAVRGLEEKENAELQDAEG